MLSCFAIEVPCASGVGSRLCRLMRVGPVLLRLGNWVVSSLDVLSGQLYVCAAAPCTRVWHGEIGWGSGCRSAPRSDAVGQVVTLPCHAMAQAAYAGRSHVTQPTSQLVLSYRHAGAHSKQHAGSSPTKRAHSAPRRRRHVTALGRQAAPPGCQGSGKRARPRACAW